MSVLLRRALVWASIVWLAAVVFTGAKAAGHDALTARPSIEFMLIVVGALVLVFALPHSIVGDGPRALSGPRAVDRVA